MAYAPHLLPRAYSSLVYSYNWMVRNWDYLEEIGMVRNKSGRTEIENSLIYALYHFSWNMPIEALPDLPKADARHIIAMAQKFINADK